jgi:hypothetical protein
MASNWQKRARNMLDMLNPGASKGAAVRADQLRQLHSSGAAVPVNMPEKEQLQLVISFWAQWEARVSTCTIVLHCSIITHCGCAQRDCAACSALTSDIFGKQSDSLTVAQPVRPSHSTTIALGADL